jgi:hypothetical protein
MAFHGIQGIQGFHGCTLMSNRLLEGSACSLLTGFATVSKLLPSCLSLHP